MDGGAIVNTAWNSEDWFWKRTLLYSAAAVAVVAAGGAYYYFQVLKREPEVVAEAPSAQPAVPPPAAPETEHHPLPGPTDLNDKPLPKLADSDPDFTASLTDFFGKPAIDQLLVPEKVIRNIVVTVDNLPRHKVSEQLRPVKPMTGTTITATSGDSITLTDENYARYKPLIRIVQNTDTKRLGDLYIRYYPLFQDAYEDLGYPGQYFNDRLVQVIDHMLQTPETRGPVQLRQGRVFYEYADPSLEARSAGQKLLLRMGNENAAVIKNKLREFRTVITTSRDPPGDAAPGGPGDVATPGVGVPDGASPAPQPESSSPPAEGAG